MGYVHRAASVRLCSCGVKSKNISHLVAMKRHRPIDGVTIFLWNVFLIASCYTFCQHSVWNISCVYRNSSVGDNGVTRCSYGQLTAELLVTPIITNLTFLFHVPLRPLRTSNSLKAYSTFSPPVYHSRRYRMVLSSQSKPSEMTIEAAKRLAAHTAVDRHVLPHHKVSIYYNR